MMELHPRIILGIDTHLDAHVAAAITTLGQALGTRSIPTSAQGYRDLLQWAEELGEIEKVGIEGGLAPMGLISRASWWKRACRWSGSIAPTVPADAV